MKAVSTGLLDDLFGIKRVGRGKAQQAEVEIKGALGAATLDMKLQTKLDPDVRLNGGKALGMVGEAPVIVQNQVGKGQAIMLNCQLLVPKPDDQQAANVRTLLAALYGVAKTTPAIRVSSPDGQPLMATETRVWRNGNALVFGLWRQMKNTWFSPTGGTTAGAPVAAKIQLPAKLHVYDLRSGKYLGQTDSLSTRLRWGRANFFLALPYPLKGLKVAVNTAAPKRGQSVTATVSLPLPAPAKEMLTAYVQLFTPGNEQPLWGRWVAVLKNGQAQVQVPVAFNDAPGTWRIKATEPFSKLSAEASWKVP
jgi:hypothetical protein